MKTAVAYASIAAVAAALALPALAMGRHDEKPHGVTKPAPQQTQPRRQAAGGRHDEGMTTHGMPPAQAAPKATPSTPPAR